MITVESSGVVPLLKEGDQWQVLLILHKEGRHWGFPKGKRDPGETLQQTAVRELKEETGLDISEFLLFEPLTEHYRFRRKGEIIAKTVSYFPALVSGTLVLQEEEIRAARWMTLQEAFNQLSYQEASHILREVMKALNIS